MSCESFFVFLQYFIRFKSNVYDSTLVLKKIKYLCFGPTFASIQRSGLLIKLNQILVKVGQT